MTSDPRAGWPRIWQIIEEFPTHPLEVLGAFSSFWRGIWLVTFAGRVHNSPVAAFIEALMPMPAWGLLLMVMGAMQLRGLQIERDDPAASLLMRWVASLVIGGLSFVMLVGYGAHEIDSIAIPLYLTMFTKQVWIFMRSRAPSFRNSSSRIVRRRDDTAEAHGSV